MKKLFSFISGFALAAILGSTVSAQTTSATVEKLWSKTTTELGATVNDTRQGIGRDGVVYLLNKANQSLVAVSAEGQDTLCVGPLDVAEGVTASLDGTACTLDDAGNFVIEGTFPNIPSHLVLRKADGSIVKDYAIKGLARTDYITATGDVFSAEGGHVFLYGNNANLLIYKVAEGVLVGDPIEVVGVTNGNNNNVISGDDKTQIIHHRTSQAGWMQVENGSESLIEGMEGFKNTTMGGDIITLAGKEFYIYPTGTTNYNSEFCVRNMTDGVFVVDKADGSTTSFTPNSTEAVSSTIAACWLSASKIDDNNAYIHVFNSQGVAVYKLSVSTPVDTPVDTPSDSYVIKYTSSNGNIVTPYASDVFGANIVSNTYSNGQGVITFDGPVTSIGEDAFFYCSSLTSITIPNSVTYIGSDAFGGCSSLTSITIPNSVTSIGSNAFCECTSLTSVTIGNSVTRIGYSAFTDCFSLTSVTIGNSVTSIGIHAFSRCSSLTKTNYTGDVASWCNIKFGDSDANPMYYSHNFYINDVEIKDLVIPNSVDSIHNYAFYKCSSLNSITIPNSVTSIGSSAFAWCTKLGSVYVKCLTPPTIAANAFYNTSPICYIPCGTLSAYKTSNWSSQVSKFIEECEENTITYTTSDGNIVTPYNSYVFGVNIVSNTYSNGQGVITFDGPVTRIGGSAFIGRSSLTSITIPNSVTTIGYSAFEDCSSLTSITIPNSVTSIGREAFNGTAIYKDESNWKNDVLYIDNCLIVARTSISGVYTIKENTRLIADIAFYVCSSLTSITIPNSVTSIGVSAFNLCAFTKDNFINNSTLDAEKNNYWGARVGDTEMNGLLIKDDTILVACRRHLTSVTIPNSVTSIGEYAFSYCSSLTSVTINSDAILSKNYTWDANISHIFGSQVTEYIIGDSVTSIGSHAFYGCSSLTSVTIGNSVTSIDDSAFYGCSSLIKTNYTGDVASWCNIKFDDNCSNPMFHSHNFYINDVEIKDLVIPNSVDSIHNYAFIGCSSLTSVTIGNSVTSIDNSAFYGCSSLTKTNYMGDVASWCNIKFDDNYSNPMFYSHNFYINDVEIKDLVIPNSVDSIHNYAFSYCSSLTSVTIGNSVTSIGAYAFYDCTSLISVTCEAITPPIVGGFTFDGVLTSIPVYVPCGTVSAYYAAKGWKDFYNIQVPLAEYSITISVNDSIMGSANVDRNSICGNQISATPNFGYYFVQWSDGSTENPRTLTLTQDTILTAEFAQIISGQCGNSLYWNYEAQNNLLSITGTDGMYNYETSTNTAGMLTCAEARDIASESNYQGTENVTIYGYVTNIVNSKYDSNTSRYKQCFHMSDTKNGGNTFYAYWAFVPNYFSVGDKVTLTGKLKNYSGTEEIVDGEAAHFIDMPNNPIPWLQLTNSIKEIIIENGATSIGANAFNSCSEINKITLSNSLQSIGGNAFSGCTALNEITLPASVKSIGENAFAGCTKLYDIYCFAMEPPTAYESSFANYNAFLHVPCDNQRVYLLDVIFGNFKFIECIEAETTPTDTIVVTPSFNDAEFIWPTNSSADSYTLAISKDGEVFCTLTFNANGQLTGIAFAPSRNGQHNAPAAAQTANGFAFTVTGLDEGTEYSYELLIQDRSGNTLQSYSGEFRTQSTNDRTVTVEYDAAQGQVNGAGTYLVGDTVTLTAIPNDGYRFVRWSNEVEDNPYTFVITENITLSAEFEKIIATSIEHIHSQSPMTDCQKIIHNGQLLILRDGKIYTVMGQKL